MVNDRRVLLLCCGDDQYHDHRKIGAFLQDMLTSSGCASTYAEDFNALSAGTLRRCDAVVMYAVSASAPPDNIHALLEAVRGDAPNDQGRPVGFVGLHGVTTSFQDNEEWKRLVGAGFVSHPDMGPAYRFTVGAQPHPVMRGVAAFDLVDELYFFNIHTRFTTLLSCFHEGLERPVAWCKPYGKGRVFYLALGHDILQLGNGNVRRLIENGAGWAAGIDSRTGGGGAFTPLTE